MKPKKRITQPISITVTQEQRDWIDAQVDLEPGSTRTEFIRRIITDAMRGPCKLASCYRRKRDTL